MAPLLSAIPDIDEQRRGLTELGFMANAADRYRSLLDASSAVADQPTVKAVLHSLRGVLASTCALHGVFLYVLDDDGDLSLIHI